MLLAYFQAKLAVLKLITALDFPHNNHSNENSPDFK